jgi:hypothetical protein
LLYPKSQSFSRRGAPGASCPHSTSRL